MSKVNSRADQAMYILVSAYDMSNCKQDEDPVSHLAKWMSEWRGQIYQPVRDRIAKKTALLQHGQNEGERVRENEGGRRRKQRRRHEAEEIEEAEARRQERQDQNDLR